MPIKSSAVAVKKKHPGKPTYAVMVLRAVKDLEDRSGSSLSAITNYISSHYGTLNKSALSNALKKSVEDQTLVKVRASYKLGAKGKAATKPSKVRTLSSPKKPTAKSNTSTSSSSSVMPRAPAKVIKKKAPSAKVSSKKTSMKKNKAVPSRKKSTSKKSKKGEPVAVASAT